MAKGICDRAEIPKRVVYISCHEAKRVGTRDVPLGAYLGGFSSNQIVRVGCGIRYRIHGLGPIAVLVICELPALGVWVGDLDQVSCSARAVPVGGCGDLGGPDKGRRFAGDISVGVVRIRGSDTKRVSFAQ